MHHAVHVLCRLTIRQLIPCDAIATNLIACFVFAGADDIIESFEGPECEAAPKPASDKMAEVSPPTITLLVLLNFDANDLIHAVTVLFVHSSSPFLS